MAARRHAVGIEVDDRSRNCDEFDSERASASAASGQKATSGQDTCSNGSFHEAPQWHPRSADHLGWGVKIKKDWI